MSGPSSTSSSDAPGGRATLARTLGWSLLFAAIVRVAIGLLGPEDLWPSEMGNAAEYLRQATDADRDIEVVAFGSSRLRSAFLSEEWARRAGLRPDQVVSLASAGGRPFHALYMLRKAGGLPASTRVAIVEISHWAFNQNWRHPVTGKRRGLPPHGRQWATLDQRLHVDDPLKRGALLLEYVWPTQHRSPLGSWIGLSEPGGARAASLPKSQIHWDESLRQKLSTRRAFRPAWIARRHFAAPEYSSFAERNLTRLVAQLRDGGRQVLLVQVPVRARYLETVSKAPAAQALYDRVDALARRLQGPGISLFVCEIAAGCGLEPSALVDYGHMSREGARGYTRWLYGQVTRQP